jgi:hypothetical protein
LPVGVVSRFRRVKWKETNVFEYPRYLSYGYCNIWRTLR